jgi:spore germination cell wall hydrolase CwlJ-like protein
VSVEVGGRVALAEWDTEALSIEQTARANPRALGGAVLAGFGLAAALSAAYLAGGAARTAAAQKPAVRVAVAGPVAKSTFVQPVQPAARLAVTPVSLRGSAPEPAAPDAGVAGRTPGALDCLTDAVYYEARGESDRGQAAVAQVVLNRVRRAGFPKSVCGVVFQGAAEHSCQFSFACDGAMRQPREQAAWKRARSVAQRALDGRVMEEVGDATNFHVASLGQIWGAGLVKVAQVGAHVFYKLTNHGTFVAQPAPSRRNAIAPQHPDAPVTADGVQAPSLILASAVTLKPMGQGGPIGPVSEPASAPTAATPAAAKVPGSAAKSAPVAAAAATAAVPTSPKADS